MILATEQDITSVHYLGSLNGAQDSPNPKYVDYTNRETIPRQSYRLGTREEFTSYLSRVGVSIDSDDVPGILKVKFGRRNFALFGLMLALTCSFRL